MVQEKNAAQKRIDHRRAVLDRIDREHPVVQTKWAVEEVRPAYNTGGYYDQDIPEDSRIVSPSYDDRKIAEAWMDAHEADEGKYLVLVKLTAREYRHVVWNRVRVRK